MTVDGLLGPETRTSILGRISLKFEVFIKTDIWLKNETETRVFK